MSKGMYIYRLLASISLLAVILFSGATTTMAQGSSFTYQGRLTESTKPADGLFDMQFKIFDTATVGTGIQQGSTITNSSVQVTNAVFAVQLDFGAAVFDGSPRFLEISVRSAGSLDPYTVLSPRQPLSAAPYAIRSTTATNATQLGGLTAGGFIQNTTSQQPGTSFNISGNGSLAGTLSAGVVNTGVQYNINGNRVLSAAGFFNLFAGLGAGAANTTGSSNSFFGSNAGMANTTACCNSFFGAFAGVSNNTGSSNSFFGADAGAGNTTGGGNSFFGNNTGSGNSTGNFNSFFGYTTGESNTTGFSNSFFGVAAGLENTVGSNNSFFGSEAGFSNITGSNNAFFGHRAGRASTAGSSNSYFGVNAGLFSTGSGNSFFGADAGENTTSSGNSFFGTASGLFNTTGDFNSFFGLSAGQNNTTGGSNAFFGFSAGLLNTTACCNAFFGVQAGNQNTTGQNNSFFGMNAGLFNSVGNANSYYGVSAGQNNTSGGTNSFFGYTAGIANTTGDANTFIGYNAGSTNTTGTNNILIGAGANVSFDNLTNATAIGANTTVSASNTMVLGTGAIIVRIPGSLVVTGTVSKGGGSFKIDHPLDPENRTLSHSFVESPDMMNIYNGNSVLDRRGEAVVTLPAYFEALNRDFRYHLTCIGGFAPVYIAQEIKGNRFKIAGGKPGMKISWQVTGVRQDAYANTHRIPVEEEKPASERGSYLHPDAFDKPSIKQARATDGSRAKQRRR